MPPLEPAPGPQFVRQEVAIAEDGVKGLDLGAGGAETAVGDAVAGEDSPFPGRSARPALRSTGGGGRGQAEESQEQGAGEATGAKEGNGTGQWQVAPSRCSR
ncbi:hypothetical protein [Geobacter argillaceus]|uniref:hypothetical protein n=1 Tax=Geobacter argillaceus TaxID=345631 RepID=UPI001FE47AC8|nr:hypothetical protein [Geobacter argillaceus]